MAKTKLILLHGMGVHGAGWSSSIVDLLRDLHDRYKSSRRLSFDRKFEPVEIVYDDVIAELLERWSNEASSLGSIPSEFVPEVVDNTTRVLNSARKNQFGWTHAADVIIYRFLPHVRERVKVHVADQLRSHLHADDSQWVVLAHSLGTAVAHDTLDMLWTGTLPNGTPSSNDPRFSQCQLVAMVANVSRVLQTVPKAYESTVMPGNAGARVPGDPGRFRGCRDFMNVRHVLDPFLYPRMFRPVDWPDRETASADLYRDIELTDIAAPNVHALEHYLGHPDVFLEFFRRTGGKTLIPDDAEQQAYQDYKAKLKPEAVAVRIKEALEPVQPGITALWPSFSTIWDKYVEILEALNDG